MALIRFDGKLKSKRFDEFGNCFVTIDIDECYKENYRGGLKNIGEHIPRCNEFKIENKRPLSCVNDIDLAINADIGVRTVIEAYELFDMKGKPVNRYQTVEFSAWY
jgi:hypothetical protein